MQVSIALHHRFTALHFRSYSDYASAHIGALRHWSWKTIFDTVQYNYSILCLTATSRSIPSLESCKPAKMTYYNLYRQWHESVPLDTLEAEKKEDCMRPEIWGYTKQQRKILFSFVSLAMFCLFQKQDLEAGCGGTCL